MVWSHPFAYREVKACLSMFRMCFFAQWIPSSRWNVKTRGPHCGRLKTLGNSNDLALSFIKTCHNARGLDAPHPIARYGIRIRGHRTGQGCIPYLEDARFMDHYATLFSTLGKEQNGTGWSTNGHCVVLATACSSVGCLARVYTLWFQRETLRSHTCVGMPSTQCCVH